MSFNVRGYDKANYAFVTAHFKTLKGAERFAKKLEHPTIHDNNQNKYVLFNLHKEGS